MPANSLIALLDTIETAAHGSAAVSVDDMLDAIGRRSFSPVLLLAGLIMLTPIIGDIPGVPVLMGLIVIVTASQLSLGRSHLWVPRWMTRQSVASDKLLKVIAWLRRPARFVDSWTRPRLEWAVRRASVHVIAMFCILIAATTPALELVPFSANVAGFAIAAFALALFTGDGLIALLAALFSAGALAALVVQFF